MDAAAVFYVDDYLPIYYEISASVQVQKPTGGWKANAYVIFDYFSPTDFKFAGIDVAINKIVMGHRDASGWHVDVQSSVPGHLNSDTFYSMLVAVNGTTVTVQIDGTLAFTYTFAPRILDGEAVGLNKGLVGLGSDNSRGVYDNLVVQKLPPLLTLNAATDFSAATSPLATPASGSWTRAGGRYAGTAVSGATAVDLVDFAALGTTDTGFAFDAFLEVTGTVRTAGIAGLVFDGYAADDFKFAAVDIPGQRVIIGHVDPRRGWVIDAAVSKTLNAGTDYVLDLVMKGTTISVTINGSFALSFSYNASVVDGAVGLVGRSGTVDAASFRVQTDDPAFSGGGPPPPPPNPSANVEDVSVAEGNSGSRTVSVTISLSQAPTSVVTVPWSTADVTATAGSDYVAASGTATFNPGETSKVISITINGDTVVEPDETFQVRLGVPTGADLAKGIGTITITNDDVPAVSIADATVTEGNSGTKTVTLTLTLSAASATVTSVTWATANGTATAGSDYVAGNGTVTFAAGVTTATINVTINGDTTYEPDERFTVTLSNPQGMTISRATATVTITNDDASSAPTISIGNATITEGDKKTSPVTLLVTLSAPSATTIKVSFTTTAGSATAGSDYQTLSGTLTFNPGVTQQSITIQIVNDRTAEPDETFTVVLSGATGGATIASGTGTVTILDNDRQLTAAALGPGASTPLTAADAGALLDAAVATWRAAGADVGSLAQVTLQIASLPGTELAEVVGSTIVLDADAAGWGWSIDPAAVAPGRMDLETVLLHEVGHLLGYEHDATGFMHEVMQATLTPGTRRVVGPPVPVAAGPIVGPQPAPLVVIAPAPAVTTPTSLVPPLSTGSLPNAALAALLAAVLGLAWYSVGRRSVRVATVQAARHGLIGVRTG